MTTAPAPDPTPGGRVPPAASRRHRGLLLGVAAAALAAVAVGVAVAAGGDGGTAAPGPTVPAAPTASPTAAPTTLTPPAASTSSGTQLPPTRAPSTTATRTVEPPVDATGPLTEEQAKAAAEAVYRKYLRISDQVGQGGYQSAEPYKQVLVGPALRLAALATERLEGQRQLGSAAVSSIDVEKVSLREEPGYYPEVVMLVCTDVRGVSGLDKAGKPLPTTKRPDGIPQRFTVHRYQPNTPGVPPAGGWYAYEATSANLPRSC